MHNMHTVIYSGRSTYYEQQYCDCRSSYQLRACSMQRVCTSSIIRRSTSQELVVRARRLVRQARVFRLSKPPGVSIHPPRQALDSGLRLSWRARSVTNAPRKRARSLLCILYLVLLLFCILRVASIRSRYYQYYSSRVSILRAYHTSSWYAYTLASII